MKQFFKFMFASTLGTIIGLTFMFFISGMIIAGIIGSAIMMAGKSEKKEKIKSNSVLVVDLEDQIVERTAPSPFENIEFEGFDDERGMELRTFLKALKDAKNDERIKGIYLKGSFFNGSMATVDEVRNALIDFQDSGKFVLAYNEVYTQGAYYIATAASELYMFQEGLIEVHGLGSEVAYFKNTMEKLGVKAVAIKGPDNKFKSAIEPFTREDMSPENREQIQRIVDVLWSKMSAEIAESRNMSLQDLNSIVDELKIRKPEDAVDLGLVDGLAYYDEILANLRGKLGLEEDDDIDIVEIEDYARADHKLDENDDDEKSWELKDEIALIYAIGGIGSGEGDHENIGSETLAKAIRQAREDDDVKAIVMRVVSPGGSALASDVIWREAKLAAEEKPFIVSMGSVAASGGYYISTHADRIFASPNTITGSIGVFGLIPDVRGLVTDKMGITFDGVKTNKHSDFGSMKRGFDEAEMALFNDYVTETYEEFIGRVAEGRGMSIEMVDSIGRGRVWVGTDALEIGLIDELGSLDDAIAYAAAQAELNDYDLIELPKKKNPWEEFFEDFSVDAKATVGEWVFGEEYKWVKQIETVKQMEGVQARIPFVLEVK
ncbi:MAG: signal peptide peptidase SppA [Flavobacteriales bacterium]